MVDEETWMECSRERGQDSAVAEGDAFDGFVVREHGDDDVAAARLGDRTRRPRTLGGQRVDLAPRPVVDGHLVARLDQVHGHG